MRSRVLTVFLMACGAVLLLATAAVAHCTFGLDRERTTPGGQFVALGETFTVGERVIIKWYPGGRVLDDFIVEDTDGDEGVFRRQLRAPDVEPGPYIVTAEVHPGFKEPYEMSRPLELVAAGAPAGATSTSPPDDPPPPTAAHDPVAQPAPQPQPATQPQPAEAPAPATQPAHQASRVPATAPVPMPASVPVGSADRAPASDPVAVAQPVPVPVAEPGPAQAAPSSGSQVWERLSAPFARAAGALPPASGMVLVIAAIGGIVFGRTRRPATEGA